jgi:hypothetical protein
LRQQVEALVRCRCWLLDMLYIHLGVTAGWLAAKRPDAADMKALLSHFGVLAVLLKQLDVVQW